MGHFSTESYGSDDSNEYKYSIGIIAGGLPFNGDSLYSKSLGGSETAVLLMARALAALGHEVKVFCNTPDKTSCLTDLVSYHDLSTLETFAPCCHFDLLVVSRSFDYGSLQIKAKMKWLWNHDILTPSLKDLFIQSLWGFDKVLFLSQYQKNQYFNLVKEICKPSLDEMSVLTTNFIDASLIKCDGKIVRQKLHFMYTARPERGLEYLLNIIWPLIRAQHPEATLSVCAYDLGTVTLTPYMEKKIKALDDALNSNDAKRIGVTNLGALTKEELYLHLQKTNAVLYPTEFPEISCISAMEALANGTNFVTTDNYALPETLDGLGHLVKGSPGSPSYVETFVQTVSDLIKGFSSSFKQTVRMKDQTLTRYEVSTVAESWIFELEREFEERLELRENDILQNLFYHSAIMPVKEYAEKNALTAWVTKTDAVIQRALDEQAAATYFKHQNRHDAWDTNPRYATVLSLLRETDFKLREDRQGISVLDFACGNGDFLNHLAKHLKNTPTLTGIDFSQGLIAEARTFSAQQQHKITFALKDRSHLKQMPRDQFDLVFAGEFLEHVTDPQVFLTELEYQAKPGGFIALTVPDGPWEEISAREARVTNSDKPCHLQHFELSDIQEMIGCDDRINLKAQYVPCTVSNRGEILGNWIICWQRNRPVPGFNKIDVVKKVFVTRPYESVTACIIAKDNEDTISKTIKSCRFIADHVLVNDTGSSDHTKEIAEGLGAQVMESKWEDDFSLSRNQLLKRVTSRWVFSIDTDEVLRGGKSLRKYLSTNFYNGYVIPQVHLKLRGDEIPDDTPIRLFKLAPEVTYKGRIHEHPEIGGEGIFDVPVTPSLVLKELYLEHSGYLVAEDVQDKLINRNYPMLLKELEETPQRQLAWVLLARDYFNFFKHHFQSVGGDLSRIDPLYLHKALEVLRKKKLIDDKSPYWDSIYRLYQEILECFARTETFPFGNENYPICASVLFDIGVGRLNDQKVVPERLWFLDQHEMIKFFQDQEDKVTELFNKGV